MLSLQHAVALLRKGTMQALSVLVLLAGLALAQASNLRGVNPDLASHYSGAVGTFTCISGIVKTIPFSRVNDDYCDCPDGSDEPGTSACHNGRFYCRNLGHEPRLLASAYVDDGVCDCCDGADEPKGKCQNTCLQAAAVKKEALKGKIQLHEVMLNTKKQYIAKASAFKEELKLKSLTIDDDVARQQAQVQTLKEEVTRLEAEEAARQAEEAARQAEEAAANQAAEEARKAEEAQQAAAEAATMEDRDAADSEGGQGETGIDMEAQPDEREETPEERGRRIASQWTNDPEAAAVTGHLNEVEDQAGEGEEGNYDGTEDDTDGHLDYQHSNEAAPSEHHHGEHHHYRRPPRPDPSTPLGKARSAVYDAERQLEQLQKDKENIGTYLQRPLDFGPDDIFLALANKCFTSYQTRWTYEVCMFDKAVQKEGYTNSVTVGRWYGFSPDYKTMYFTGGDECWNVGPRTMTVTLTCGFDERLSDGEEPATCAYSAKFQTPAVCTEAELQELREELQSMEAFEKEVQAKIQKDEL